MKLEASRQIFEEYSNIKFHKNLSSGIQVVPCRQMAERTDMTKLIAAFHNFLITPKNEHLCQCDIHQVLSKLFHWMENTNSPTL